MRPLSQETYAKLGVTIRPRDTQIAMNSKQRLQVRAIAGSVIAIAALCASAQGSWKLDSRGAAGPIAQIALADSGVKHRTSFIAFEYSRKCDPVFSFVEITGSRLGNPVDQTVLNGTKIGVLVNGKFWAWSAAMTKYDNGYEAGFGVTSELFDVLTGRVDSLVYVTPNGEQVSMPTVGLRQAVQSAFDTCAKRFK